jgi:type IV pilus assembly protein PilC
MPLIVTPRQFTQRAEFYHQLAQLTSAGIGVVQALEQIGRSPPSRSFREPIRHFLDSLNAGQTLSSSFQSKNWLPAFDTALIEAGERSGRLDASFRALADYYNERARITKQAISNLVYPFFLVHLAVLVFLVVLPYAHSQFNASLILLCLRAALFLAPFYGVVALLIYATQSRHGENWRALIESFSRPVPLLGKARHCLALARLAGALEALINAGVNIVEAWNMAATASGSPAFRRAIATWKPQLAAGRTPAELVRECRLFPETFANLYAAGEVSGKLDETLRRLNAFYQEEGNLKLQMFTQWTPRLLYFIVALVIAWQIIKFWQGYFNQINSLTNF